MLLFQHSIYMVVGLNSTQIKRQNQVSFKRFQKVARFNLREGGMGSIFNISDPATIIPDIQCIEANKIFYNLIQPL